MTTNIVIANVASQDILGHVVGEPDYVDPPLSFNILLGFLFLSDDALAFSSMDLSFSSEYLYASSIDNIDICAPHSPTTQIHYIDVR